MKIICVDDDSIFLGSIVKMCEELPQIDEVRGFLDPGSAMKWTENNSADIALLDINMPKMNGLQLAAHIRSVCPDISVIFVTGDDQYAVEAFEQHASAYLLKPINKRRLEAEIEDAISHKVIQPKEHIVVKTGRMSFMTTKRRSILMLSYAVCKARLNSTGSAIY